MFQIADDNAVDGQFGKTIGPRRSNGRDHVRPHGDEKSRDGGKEIRIGGDADARPAELELAIDHGILQLRALALDPGRDRVPAI